MLHRPQYFEINRDSSQAKGLVGWWPFFGKSQSLFDLSGYSNHGTLNGPQWKPNNFLGGQTLDFDGINDRVNMGDVNIWGGLTTASWSMWLRLATTAVDQNAMSKWATSSSTTFLFNFITGAGDIWIAPNSTSDFTVVHANIGAGVFFANQWQHAVVVFDGNGSTDSAKLKLYVDGLDIAFSGFPGGTPLPTSLSGSTTDFEIGSNVDEADFYTGQITDVRAYNMALSPTKVQQIYRPSTRWELYKQITRAIRKSTVSVPVVLAAPQEKRPAYFEINRASPQADGLVGWWPFFGKSQTLFDFSGYSNHGTLTNGPIWTANDFLGGQALDFDGSDDFVNVGDPPSLDITGTITISAWIRPDISPVSMDAFSRIVNKTDNDEAYRLNLDGNQLEWAVNDGTTNDQVDFNFTFDVGVWHHVVGTWEPNPGRKRVYIDGIMRNDLASVNTSIESTLDPISFGGDTTSSSWNGAIDDVRIYNRALSRAEVWAVYDPSTRWDLYRSLQRRRKIISRQKPLVSFVTQRRAPQGKRPEYFQINRDSSQAKGLIGWWPFFGKSQTLFDFSGYGNHGTITNGPIWKPNQFLGGHSLDFDGVDDIVNAGSNATIDNIFAGGGTFTAWINARSVGEANFGRIVDKSSSVIQADGWALLVKNTSNPRMGFGRGFTTNVGNWDSPLDSIPFNVWLHVAVTYNEDFDNNNAILYINGESVVVSLTDTPSGSAQSDAAEDLTIGNFKDTDVTFDGLISDVRLYDRILASGEIWAIFAPYTRWDLYESLLNTKVALIPEVLEVTGTSTPLVGAAVLAGIASHMDLGITVRSIRR